MNNIFSTKPSQSRLKSTMAALLLLFFTGLFTVDSISHQWSEGHQTEWIDFENDQEKEKDSEEKKHNQDKLLSDWSVRIHRLNRVMNDRAFFPVGLNEQINEVLSPPPDRA